VSPSKTAKRGAWLTALLLSTLAISAGQSVSITEYPTGGGLYIVSGPDGALWFTTDNNANPKISRITTAGMVTEYSVSSAPSGITVGPDGALWFTENGFAPKIGRITTAGSITEYTVPTLSLFTITLGPDGNLWFTEPTFGSGKIGKITTAAQAQDRSTGRSNC
jgi:virginiamycin B lyase